MIQRVRVPVLFCLLALALALALPAGALEPRERIELTDLLTLDDTAAFDEADEAFTRIQSRVFEMESELDVAKADFALVADPLEEAQAELEIAQADLRDAVEAEAPADEIADLEDAVHGATEWVDEARAEIEPYSDAVAEAQSAFDALKDEYWEKRRALDRSTKEVRGTALFIERLDDKRADALYDAMMDAAARDALPLDIDLETLQLISHKNLGRRAIEKLPAAFEEARRQGTEGLVTFLCAIGDADCPNAPPEPAAGVDLP